MMLAAMVLAAVVAAGAIPHPTVNTALAAPAALDASFRDLPSTVRAGDVLSVQVSAPSGASCDGTITYRDGAVQNLDPLNESGGRCRWNLTVLSNARRGTADIAVNVKKDDDQATIEASIEVTRRGDDVMALFHDLPGTVRRGDDVTLRVDVDSGASCQGTVVYDDARAQTLAPQNEQRERCRWTFTVPTDAAYGIARMVIGVTVGTSQTTVAGSFEVARRAEDAHVTFGLKDLPATVRRDDSFAIRALVPTGATCTGSVAYFGLAPQSLDAANESDGECRWTTRVPSDARAGTAEIDVTATQGTDSGTVVALIGVDRSTSNVDATFKDLADSIQRGQSLEIRVTVPDDATCSGTLTYDDGTQVALAPQTERKDRCLWEIDIPSNAARGTAVVRVTVNDGSNSTTLLSNVEVLNKNEVLKAGWASDLPNSAKPGDAFDLKVRVPSNASCSGTITYADSSKSTLQDRDEDGSQCRWRVSVPANASAGTATVQVSVLKDGRETKLSGSFQVAAN